MSPHSWGLAQSAGMMSLWRDLICRSTHPRICTKIGVDIRQPSGVESRVSVQFLKVSVTHNRSRTTALRSLPLQSCCASCNAMGLHIPENSMGRHSCQWVKVAQSYLTLCTPMDCRPLGSSVHGISQARILEQVAIPFSRGSSRPRDPTWVSRAAGRLFTVGVTREAPCQDTGHPEINETPFCCLSL